jgi:hypothetical protein
MTVIESVTPIFKSILRYQGDRNGVRPIATQFYSKNADGEQRMLIPVGQNEYDVLIELHAWRIHCSIDCVRARHMAAHIPKTYIEEKMPCSIRNTYYYVTYDNLTGGLFHQSTQNYSGKDREKLFLFKSNQDPAAVRSWIREKLGFLYLRRSERIVESMARKHQKPYKFLKAIVEFFETVGKVLIKLGRQGPRLQKLAPKAWAPAPVPETDIQCKAAAWILDVARGVLPLAEHDVMSMIWSYYPGLAYQSERAVRAGYATA